MIKARPTRRIAEPVPKNTHVGKLVPVFGVPVVEGIVVLPASVGTVEIVGTEVTVVVGISVGATEMVGPVLLVLVGVGEGLPDGIGVFVALCPEGVAVYEGKSLCPAAKIVKFRVIFCTKPSLSV